MIKNLLLHYTNYNLWANSNLFSFVEKEVSDKDLDKVIPSSFPSLRKTIFHIWDAEYIWYRRLEGESLREWPSKNFTGSFSEARDKISKLDKLFIEYIEASDAEKLSIPISYVNTEGKSFTNPVWEAIHHIMNHSTYHRGQVVTLLRQLNVNEIPATDFIAFTRTGIKS